MKRVRFFANAFFIGTPLLCLILPVGCRYGLLAVGTGVRFEHPDVQDWPFEMATPDCIQYSHIQAGIILWQSGMAEQ